MNLLTLNLHKALAWSTAQAAEAGVRSAYDAIRTAASSTEGTELALSWAWETVVDERGYVVTKASEFESGEPFQIQTPAGEPAPEGKDGVAARIRNRAQEIARTERVAFSVAFRRAEGEIGDR